MRYYLIFLFVLFTKLSFGQYYHHLHKTINNSEFKYQYWFQFDDTKDSSYYVLDKVQDTTNIQIIGNCTDSLFESILKFHKFENDSVFFFYYTDFKGRMQIELDPGKYEIKIITQIVDPIFLNIELAENEQFKVIVYAGFTPETTIYELNSIDKISGKEMWNIMDCIRIFKNIDPHCIDEKRFNISKHNFKKSND